MARAYVTSYQMPIIVTRSNNVYGPHQFPEKLSECRGKRAVEGAAQLSRLPAGAEGVALGQGHARCSPTFPARSPCAVPKFALLASRGEELPVHGDGGATRSYLLVADVAEAFDLILHKARREQE